MHCSPSLLGGLAELVPSTTTIMARCRPERFCGRRPVVRPLKMLLLQPRRAGHNQFAWLAERARTSSLGLAPALYRSRSSSAHANYAPATTHRQYAALGGRRCVVAARVLLLLKKQLLLVLLVVLAATVLAATTPTTAAACLRCLVVGGVCCLAGWCDRW